MFLRTLVVLAALTASAAVATAQDHDRSPRTHDSSPRTHDNAPRPAGQSSSTTRR